MNNEIWLFIVIYKSMFLQNKIEVVVFHLLMKSLFMSSKKNVFTIIFFFIVLRNVVFSFFAFGRLSICQGVSGRDIWVSKNWGVTSSN